MKTAKPMQMRFLNAILFLTLTLLVVVPGGAQHTSVEIQFLTVSDWHAQLDPLFVSGIGDVGGAALDRVIGIATDIFPRGNNIERLGEVAIGNVVADSMRLRYGTQLAITNGGGLRAPLPSSHLPADLGLRRTSPGYAPGPPFDLVVGDAIAVLPFGNVIVTRTVTGALLYAVLEHSVAALPSANGRFLQISGFRFTFDSSRPPGSRVVSVMLDDGTMVFPDATTFTLAVPDFVNAGGDGYTMLADGQGTTRELMADVLQSHIEGLGVITPTIEGRIVDVKP